MSEFEIVLMINEYTNRIWTIMQFWSSISFGLIIVAYAGSKKLSLSIVITITCLYIAFSFFVFNILKINGGMNNGYIIDLQNMIELGEVLAHGSKNLIEVNVNQNNLLLIVPVYLGTFFGSLTFLWYSYFSSRKLKHQDSRV